MRRIVFSLRARQEEIVPARKNRVEIFFRLEVESLKTAELIEQTASDDQDVFFGGFINLSFLAESVRRSALAQDRTPRSRSNPAAVRT